MQYKISLGCWFIDAEGNRVRNWQIVNETGLAVATLDLRGNKATRFLACSKAPDNAKSIMEYADNEYMKTTKG